MSTLIAKMEELQQNQVDPSLITQEEEDDAMGLGNLVILTESTQALLEAAFSAILANADCKRLIEHIGVPDCDSIHSPKLDPAIQIWFQQIPSVTE